MSKTKLLHVLFAFSIAVAPGELSDNNHGIRRAIRYRKVEVTTDTGSFKLLNLSVIQFGNDQKLFSYVEATRDINFHSASVVLTRCSYDGLYDCEYFQTWSFSAEIISTAAYMNGQVWSPMLNAIHPKLRFPHSKKGFYTMTNGTLDIDALMKVFPEASKYSLDVGITVENRQKQKELIFHFVFSIYEYRERNRTANYQKPFIVQI